MPQRICLNGHVDVPPPFGEPENTPRCDQCGEPVVEACASCDQPLPKAPIGYNEYVPACCKHCGEPHEWTKRKTQAAIDLFVEDICNDEESVGSFATELDHIARNTSRASLASVRMQRLLTKVGSHTAGLIRDIIVASAVIAEQLRNK